MADGPNVDFYSFPYPTRMVIARLEGGHLWVWSPITISVSLRSEIEALGQVSHLVSPNKIHHLFLADWKAIWPNAILWGPKSTIDKRKDLAFGPALEDIPPSEWGPDIDQAWFRGSFMMDEVVFFHRPSRTAIFADLIESFTEDFLQKHWSWWQRPLAHIDGITAKSPHAPGEWRLSFTDRSFIRTARDKVIDWAPGQVTVAHGEWCQSEGKRFVTRALEWID
ncbi:MULTISPECIES: DUF4336 domain-containing protein [unclassified Pseudovibrio]|uniref:DUF4336 domain-containing protein n=1 Tax=unclassified Pseudovibrio TaxID=2627060 RepID=UPI0007AE8B31|nr:MULTISPECIES: DUF4336 domain-containing protein [unclassified Pseudovibrio]KZL24592.1 hypothetical protein PsAD37_02607 [Pseudovibrio sp. Ad37]KZL24646.1 hypothetical protein PsWM33_02500 [Pseudovibrio sp. WM33]